MSNRPSRYTKKPVTIEAMVVTEGSAQAVAHWCGGRLIWEAKHSDPADVYIGIDIPTLEGTMRANLEDFVIRGIKGEFYPCKPDIFWATHDKES